MYRHVYCKMSSDSISSSSHQIPCLTVRSSHQTTSTTGVSISKMSFLSNLETRLYKHIPHTKPACGQGPYGQPQSKNTYTSTTATLLASSKSSAQIMSSSAHNRSAAPGLDVSISDEAFLDLDLDCALFGSFNRNLFAYHFKTISTSSIFVLLLLCYMFSYISTITSCYCC